LENVIRNIADTKNASTKMAMGTSLPMPISKSHLSIGLGRRHQKTQMWNAYIAHIAAAIITKWKTVIMPPNLNV